MKRILLVADEPGWIFERHCREIKKRLSEYNIDIAYHRQNIPRLSKDYDCVYVCDPMPMAYPPASKTIMGLRNEFLYIEHPRGPMGLYVDGFPGRCVSIKDKCKILHVVNRNQMDALRDVVTDKPLVLAQHGIDEEVFDMQKYQREAHDGIRVSGAGRSSHNKAFGEIAKACEAVGFQCVMASYGRRRLTKEQMPHFYNSVDIHVCFSANEGQNNPMMEAGGMGIPVISTRSGAAKEMIRDGENGFLIERKGECLRDALLKLKDEKFRRSMGDAFYKEIMTNWTWKVRIEDFRKMFSLFFEE